MCNLPEYIMNTASKLIKYVKKMYNCSIAVFNYCSLQK